MSTAQSCRAQAQFIWYVCAVQEHLGFCQIINSFHLVATSQCVCSNTLSPLSDMSLCALRLCLLLRVLLSGVHVALSAAWRLSQPSLTQHRVV